MSESCSRRRCNIDAPWRGFGRDRTAAAQDGKKEYATEKGVTTRDCLAPTEKLRESQVHRHLALLLFSGEKVVRSCVVLRFPQ